MNSLSISQTCKNCGSEQIENYCCNCGQKIIEKRFSVKFFFIAILDTFNLERGLFYTFKMLLTKPGVVINDYISGKTKSYYNPLKYIILATAIYAFFVLWLKIFDHSVEATNELNEMLYNDSVTENPAVIAFQQKWLELVKQFINFIPLMVIPFSSLVSRRFFKSAKLFYGEHLIINSYAYGHAFFITIVLMPLVLIFPSVARYFEIISAITVISYLAYAYQQTFKCSVFKSLMGSILTYVFGLILFILFLALIITITIFILAKSGVNIVQLVQ